MFARGLKHALQAFTSPRCLTSAPITRSLSCTASEWASTDVASKIAFIGAGAMAEAMISPLVQISEEQPTPIQAPDKIHVYDVSRSIMDSVAAKYGVMPHTSIPSLVKDADIIVVAVKPQNCSVVFEQMRGNCCPDARVLSIVAGKPTKHFVDGTGLTKVVRSIPNTPAMIGEGVTVWTCDCELVTHEEKRQVKAILECLGEEIFVNDESFIDMSTSISGSGPAYIFLLIEAMTDAGVHMGFPRDTAQKLVHRTLLGSTKYAMETGDHPAVLKNNVTSPGGTTASALFKLEEGQFRTVVTKAIWACYRRSLEMGGKDSNVGPGRTITPDYALPAGEFDTDSIVKRPPRRPGGSLNI